MDDAPRPVRFVVLGHGRSGSTLLAAGLRDQGIRAYDELLHEDPAEREGACRGEVPAYRSGDDGAAYVDAVFGSHPESVLGFRLFYEHAREDDLAASAWDRLRHDETVRVVHLVRTNGLHAWISYEVARRTEVWAVDAGKNVVPPPLPAPFHVDPEELREFLDRVEAFRHWTRVAFRRHPFLELSYESDVATGFGRTVARVCAFLGTQARNAMKPRFQKRVTIEPTALVANLGELAEALRHGPHEHLFSSTPPPPPLQVFCRRPFEDLVIDAVGKVRVCCDDWLPTPIGDVTDGSFDGIWRSPTAAAIRESILDGSYRYCDRQRCPSLVKGNLPSREGVTARHARAWIDGRRTVPVENPRTLHLGYDATCNLRCPTCRPDFIVLRGGARARAEDVHQRVLEELLPDAKVVIVTGQGDAVASGLYRTFLRTFDPAQNPDLRILLLTNGLLLTPAMWESFGKARAAIACVSVSVDAATPDTYRVNRGGDFDRLRANLAFLGGLRAAGELDDLELSFVVQANNFREMPDFVDLGARLGANSTLFQRLVHWPGTFGDVEYRARAVHEPEHPEHAAFLAVLADPRLSLPGVDLSNLEHLTARAGTDRAKDPCDVP